MNRIFGRDKILRGVFVLLITAVMLLSTVAVAENTSISAQLTNIGKSESDVGILGDILFEHGFEDGIVPPDSYGWEIVNATTDPDLVHSGNYAIATRSQGAWLRFPEIDLTPNYESVNLLFWANCWTLVSGATVKVYIEKNGDGVNHKIWDMQEDEDWPEAYYRQVDLDISDFIGNIITITWQCDGMGLVCPFAMDDILVYSGPFPSPELEIGNITGGFFQVSAEIKNVGEGEANDVNWSISIYGLIRPIWGEWNGTIPNLPAGETEIVSTDGIILGFGKVDIEVKASEPHYGSSDMKTVKGFVFICYIFIIDS